MASTYSAHTPPTRHTSGRYVKRAPQNTTLYKILSSHWQTYLREIEDKGSSLPKYVHDEIAAYLRCGIPAYGFMRVLCDSCGDEHCVAFSCKKRGFCPSCGGKRMAEQAVHLCDNVLPYAPYRQFVISIPKALRYWLATNTKLMSKVHRLITTSITALYLNKAKQLGLTEPQPGMITFVQRFSSAATLNIHFHLLALDGVFSKNSAGDIRFSNVGPVTDADIEHLVAKIAQRIIRHLTRKGYLNEDGDQVERPPLDPLLSEHEGLAQAISASMNNQIAFGPNAGKHVKKLGKGFGFAEEAALLKGRLLASQNNFTVHAATHVNTHSRDQLYRLIEYCQRPPISDDRLKLEVDGNIILQLKTPWKDGTKALVLSPEDFIHRLVSLIPPPKCHLVRYTGVFAPSHPWRDRIVLKPEIKKAKPCAVPPKDKEADAPEGNSKRAGLGISSQWAKLLARTFNIDVSTCAKCQGDMRIVAVVQDREQIARYLTHIGLDPDPPPIAPARAPPLEEGYFDQVQGDWG